MPKRTSKHPFKIHRQISESHCGPAVLQMLLENLGIRKTQEEITSAANCTETINKQGTRIDQLALAVKQITKNLILYYKDNASISDIKKLLMEYKLPVGIEWQGIFEKKKTGLGTEDYGHYSVITNIDEEKGLLIIVDPYRNYADSERIIRINEFISRWWDVNEITDPKTRKKALLKDNKLLFVVTNKTNHFSAKLSMKKYY